jgi:hypothetical protein
VKRAWLAAAVLACAGCDNLLGLGATRLGADGATPDACVGAACEASFASCLALRVAFPDAPSGVYPIDAGTGVFQAYCEEATDGGGWTLALKVDGRQTTFAYDQTIWETPDLLATDAPDLDHREAKLETWNAIAFQDVRVVFEFPIDSGTVHALIVPLGAGKLADLFAAGQLHTTTLGRDAWKSLLGTTASLQPNCNLEGTNQASANTRVRLGIIANQEADCTSPDSRIGVGGGGEVCGSPTESAGNSACFSPDNGDVELPAFAWVFVR